MWIGTHNHGKGRCAGRRKEGGVMEIWNKLKQPPVSALKQIRGGRLKGMTE